MAGILLGIGIFFSWFTKLGMWDRWCSILVGEWIHFTSLKAVGPKSHGDAFHLETALHSSQRALTRATKFSDLELTHTKDVTWRGPQRSQNMKSPWAQNGEEPDYGWCNRAQYHSHQHYHFCLQSSKKQNYCLSGRGTERSEESKG